MLSDAALAVSRPGAAQAGAPMLFVQIPEPGPAPGREKWQMVQIKCEQPKLPGLRLPLLKHLATQNGIDPALPN